MASWLRASISCFHIARLLTLFCLSFTASAQETLSNLPSALRAIVPSSIFHSFQSHPFLWEMVAVCAACAYLQARRWRALLVSKESRLSVNGQSDGSNLSRTQGVEDPGLLKKHSTIKSYATSFATYPSIRTFYRPHPQADKLPKEPAPIALLVFIHGLGGSLAQFTSLLTSLVNIGPCLGIDLPGCGLSAFSPPAWDAYSHEALVELLEAVIEQTCKVSSAVDVVLIGHSMGCSLAVSIASSMIAKSNRSFHIRGIVAICPKATTPSKNQIQVFRKLLSLPTPIMDLWRSWDRRGGLNSPSVTRFVGKEAHEDTKRLQMRYNEQSKTHVWRRMAAGAVPTVREDGSMKGGLPGPGIWATLSVPLFLATGEDDKITPPSEIDAIANAMGKDISKRDHSNEGSKIKREAHKDLDLNSPSSGSAIVAGSTHTDSNILDKTVSYKKTSILKTSILPSPASHGMIYDLSTYRTLSGLMQDFLADHVDKRLSLGWQLQHLKESNKWDVKNLAKWQAVTPVSEPIGGIFRAMKTLREVDEYHSPRFFVEAWRDRIKAVVDISHESPVYNPQGLDRGGVEYHKFPTVSKVPPTVDEVKDFITLVDRLRSSSPDDGRLIGVHCHYGFNRTGFFICCYLVERMGYKVQGALDEFAKGRPPGIRHEHFVDTLFVRYCVGLQRAPTF